MTVHANQSPLANGVRHAPPPASAEEGEGFAEGRRPSPSSINVGEGHGTQGDPAAEARLSLIETPLSRHHGLEAAMIQTASRAKPAHRWGMASGFLWCPDCGSYFFNAEDFCNDNTLCESCRLRPAVIKWDGFDLCPSCIDVPREA